MVDRPDAAWLEELSDWLRIPSVSADPAHASDVRAAGEWVCDFVRRAGGEASWWTRRHIPWPSARSGPRPERLTLRPSSFTAISTCSRRRRSTSGSRAVRSGARDGYLYCRGAVDDKGNAYLAQGRPPAAEEALPVNVASPSTARRRSAATRSSTSSPMTPERGADACVVFDGGMPREDVPAFDLAVRGLVYFHVRCGRASATFIPDCSGVPP